MRARNKATIALLCAAGAAHAAGPPMVKEGFWSTKIQTIESPGGSKSETASQLCRNHAYDEYLWETSKKTTKCTTISETYVGHSWSIELRCSFGPSVMDTKSVVTSDGESSIHSETTTVTTPPLDGFADTTMIGDSKYLGSCPSGVQPGDIIYSDGHVVHGWKH